MKKRYFPIIILALLAIGTAALLAAKSINDVNKKPAQGAPTPKIALSETIGTNKLVIPIADFEQRITKKTFGQYITPQNSPVKPERFTGYHTGVDVEYSDTTADIPVYAVKEGVVTYSDWVSGYGGVLILEVQLSGKPHSILYGHLRPTSLPKKGSSFQQGKEMAVLGTGYSHETDGERRHLHFSVLSNNRIDLRGYVQQKNELSGWVNPLDLF